MDVWIKILATNVIIYVTECCKEESHLYLKRGGQSFVQDYVCLEYHVETTGWVIK